MATSPRPRLSTIRLSRTGGSTSNSALPILPRCPRSRPLLLAAAARFDAILPEPAPFVNILEYRDSQIAYTLRVWVRTPDYWDVRFALLEAVGEEFDSHGVEMSYPHMNVHIVKP